ncbi:MAG: hypothetical protein C4334_00540 [Pyrinomonas sp.]|uniref:energy transducer TonB n=1 Tax=Pyrinomonas sp. TaxID=2080306 RepID=UPI003325C553
MTKGSFPRRAWRLAIVLLIATFWHVALAQDLTENPAQRIARARALAAIGELQTAAAELESVRAGAPDEVARDVARIMLMNVCVERGDYARAQVLLDEAFNLRASRGEKTKQFYFTLAGQLLNSARARVERFRQFGLNFAASDLPPEAHRDLDQLRRLLEHVIEQAQRLHAEGTKDAMALVEDVVGVRLTLARNAEERAAWQQRLAEVRQWLVVADPRIASLDPTIPSFDVRREVAASFAPTMAKSETASVPVARAEGAPSTVVPERTGAENRSQDASERPDVTTPQANKSAPSTIEVGGSLIERATQKPAPIYPPAAKTARITGTVTVYVLVNERGEVEAIVRSVGPAMLRQAAEEAVRRWRFRPAEVNGQRTRMSGFVNFNFSL